MQDLLLGNQLAHMFLQRASNESKLSHAYLIYGEKGLGKQTFAKLFAQSVLCTGESKPCGECLSCRKVLSGNHPDFRVILGGEAKGSIHIETVREIRGDCVIKPNEGIRKIYLITNIQNMTAGAFNAFLKTLEEPPCHVLFLLTAPNLESLPETIVSRLALIPLYPLSDSQIEESLRIRFPDISEEEIRHSVERAGGNLGIAIDCLSGAGFSELSDRVARLSRAVAEKKEYEILRVLTVYEKDRTKLTQLLSEFILVLRRAVLQKMSGQLLSVSELSGSLTVSQEMKLIEFLENGKQQLKLNANMSLMLIYLSAGIKRRIE